MKSFRVVFLVVLALLLGSVAQAQQNRVQGTIPFNFLVGDRLYPAGDYTIQRALVNAPVLRIDHGEARTTLVLSNTCTSVNPAEKTKFVFHRMGGSYFLYQIWVEGNDRGSEFPMSKTEIEMASNQPKLDLVIVAANIVH